MYVHVCGSECVQRIKKSLSWKKEMSTSTFEAQGRIWGLSSTVVKKEQRHWRVARRLQINASAVSLSAGWSSCLCKHPLLREPREAVNVFQIETDQYGRDVYMSQPNLKQKTHILVTNKIYFEKKQQA